MVNNKIEKKNLVRNVETNFSADLDLTSWMEEKKATIDNFTTDNYLIKNSYYKCLTWSVFDHQYVVTLLNLKNFTICVLISVVLRP